MEPYERLVGLRRVADGRIFADPETENRQNVTIGTMCAMMGKTGKLQRI